MPTYIYTNKDRTVRRAISMSIHDEHPETIEADGEILERDMGLEIAPAPCGTYPMASDAAAILPWMIPGEVEECHKAGFHTDYTPTGEPIFRDRAHRKRHLEHFGFFDRNAGFSDPTPR